MLNTHNFHVPLADSLYSELKAEARRTGKSATELARQAIRHLVEQSRRRALHDQIAAYATRAAGSSDDLDPQLEAAGLELLGKTE